VQHASHPFASVLALVFFCLQLPLILHHVMWRDEMEVWMIARHSHSIGELLYLKRYEGHPDAWYLLVYLLTRFTGNPLAMQLVHLVIASVTAYLIGAFSPFTRIQKALMVFGYFFFFEYATISRGYALGVLCVFAFCAVFRPGPSKSYPWLVVLLALLTQTSIYGIMIALALGVMVLTDVVQSGDRLLFFRSKAGHFALATLFVLASLILAILRTLPAPGRADHPPASFPLDLPSAGRTLAIISKAFVPIPALSWQFWNNSILRVPYLDAFSIPILCISIAFFVRKPPVLAAYCFGLLEFLTFQHAVHWGYARHYGHVFVLFLACMWLAPAFLPVSIPRWVDGIGQWFEPYGRRIFTGVLAVHALVAVAVSAVAYRVPFSQSKAVADYLRSRHMDRMFIVGDKDYALASVAGYLDRDIYYARGERMGSFVVWDVARTAPQEHSAVELAKLKALERQQDVIAILNYSPVVTDPSIRRLASFEDAVVADEDYFVYWVPYMGGQPKPRPAVPRQYP